MNKLLIACALIFTISCNQMKYSEDSKQTTENIIKTNNQEEFKRQPDSLEEKISKISDNLNEIIIKHVTDSISIEIKIPEYIEEPYPGLNKFAYDYLMGKDNFVDPAFVKNNSIGDNNEYHADYSLLIDNKNLVSLHLERITRHIYIDSIDGETHIVKEETYEFMVDLKKQKEISLSDLVIDEKKFREYIVNSWDDDQFRKEDFKEEAMGTPLDAMDFRMYPDGISIFFRMDAFIMRGFSTSLNYTEIKDALNVEYLKELGIDI